MTRLFARLGAGLGSTVLGAIVIFMVYFSLPLLSDEVIGTLLSTQWEPENGYYGLLPMVVGTLSIALLATSIAAMLSLSISLSIDTLSDGWFRRRLYQMLLLFGAIPTVVYGLIGVLMLVPLIRSLWLESSGMSLLAAAGMLSLVVTPTMTLFFVDSFASTRSEFKEITSALGGRKIQYQLYLLLPYHRRSLGVGLSLGLARAMGDTMIALMIAGNSIRIPQHLGDSVRTLTSHIALLFAGDFDSPAFRSIFASGLILFGLMVVLLVLVHRLRGEHHA